MMRVLLIMTLLLIASIPIASAEGETTGKACDFDASWTGSPIMPFTGSNCVGACIAERSYIVSVLPPVLGHDGKCTGADLPAAA